MKRFLLPRAMIKMSRQLKAGYLVPVALGFLVLIAADWYFIMAANNSYEEKIQILSVMIEEADNGVDNLVTSSQLLKGVLESSGEAGRDKLRAYGYLEDGRNGFQIERKMAIRNTVVFSLFTFFLYLLALAGVAVQCKKQQRQELRRLSQILDRLSAHDYALDIPERLDDRERQIDRIVGQLQSLSDQLRYHEEQLIREKEETRSLVTDISHQLKTPVAGLKACFEILNQGDLSSEEKQEFLEQCTKQLGGLEALVGSLVNISRMETGMIEICREPADILETLVAAVNRVYLKAQEKQIAIEFEETDDLAAMVIPHDVKWICEAFINILENAVKYSPSNTQIRIRMIKRITFLRIELEDQGMGIPHEAYHKIFKRFYRGESEEVRKQEGSGVGLYLTREILERHGGSVTVSSRYGKKQPGSTFVVQIPYV